MQIQSLVTNSELGSKLRAGLVALMQIRSHVTNSELGEANSEQVLAVLMQIRILVSNSELGSELRAGVRGSTKKMISS